MHAPHLPEHPFSQVVRLSDSALIGELQRLLRDERRMTARLLLHLGEIDARGLYRHYAYGSLFDYCVQTLHLSEAEAFLRIRAARLGRQFPLVLDMVERGELHLSAIKLLAPVLDQENHQALLQQARCKSKREVEHLLAQRAPKPDVAAAIRKLPERAQSTAAPEPFVPPLLAWGAQPPQAPSPQPAPQTAAPALQPPVPAVPKARPVLDPLGAGRYKLQVTLSGRVHDKLRQAQHLMGPEHELAHVLERALDLLIAARMKRRFAVCDNPRGGKPERKAQNRHIPHAVRRQVLARDGGQCTFISAEGRRCDQRGQLELHHEQPFARAGEASVSNIRLLCRAHNAFLAERDFGRTFVQQRIEQARAERGARALVPEQHQT